MAALCHLHDSSSPEKRLQSTEPSLDRLPQESRSRIYVLGVGNIGRLFAHALANKPNPPPISLIMHRPKSTQEWVEAGRKISITTNGVTNSEGKYKTKKYIPSPRQIQNHRRSRIRYLIVATKTTHTVKALERIGHLLTPDSTILFLQNGMGTMDQVTSALKLSATKSERPSYLAAVTSHGLYSQGPYSSVFAGRGSVTIGEASSPSKKQSRYLLDQIINAPLLNATEVNSKELLLQQLEKLVVNAVINPLTVIFNCKNGELFSRPQIRRVMRLLVFEASQVILSLPELRLGVKKRLFVDRFSKENLEIKVLDVAEKTAANTSSMLQDVQQRRTTEIEAINGYIIQRGMGLEIEVRTHQLLRERVLAGRIIGEDLDEAKEIFPSYGENSHWVDSVLARL
ncbi:Ketoisovalerate reductase BEA2 [Lachnellula suecica]|uniref:2-dehydropantoate 2-reductase n=1 Tax=Lachnellula suecica TaxID=602035 RepID=A0A8T9BSS4_9HELO|nr:Ketoisovalerate reductase BEA2 [Lachnellula suecica]